MGYRRVGATPVPAIDYIEVVTVDPATGLPVTGGGGGGTSGGTATAASPTYTEGATAQPLSVDLKGNLRSRLFDSAGVDVMGLVSSPGAGSLLKLTTDQLTQLTAIAASAADTTTPVNVTGYLSTVAVTPTVVASPDYTTGMTMGGIMTFASILRATGKTAYAVSLRVITKIANTAALDAFVFSASPTASTTTDNAAFLLSATDAPALMGVISLATTDWVSGGSAISVGYKEARIPITGAAATSLYVVLVARGTFNLGSTSDLIVALSTDQN